MVEDEGFCFLCLASCKHICPHCNLVHFCSQDHLSLHRFYSHTLSCWETTEVLSRHGTECLPFKAGRLPDKGRVLFATRDLKWYILNIFYISSTGCFFQLVPPRKVLSMELVPPNSKKWVSTLVPHKTQKMIEFLTNNFSVWKNTGFFCRKSQFISYRGLCNASQGMVCAPASVSSGKETTVFVWPKSKSFSASSTWMHGGGVFSWQFWGSFLALSTSRWARTWSTISSLQTGSAPSLAEGLRFLRSWTEPQALHFASSLFRDLLEVGGGALTRPQVWAGHL